MLYFDFFWFDLNFGSYSDPILDKHISYVFQRLKKDCF